MLSGKSSIGRGRAPIGADAERVGVLDLEELGHLVELRGNVSVVDGH
jgi:hypothetical protein